MPRLYVLKMSERRSSGPVLLVPNQVLQCTSTAQHAATPSETQIVKTAYQTGTPTVILESKHQLCCEPDLAFAAGSRPSPGQVQRRGDNAEGGGIGRIGARISIMRRVGRTKHLRPEL